MSDDLFFDLLFVTMCWICTKSSLESVKYRKKYN